MIDRCGRWAREPHATKSHIHNFLIKGQGTLRNCDSLNLSHWLSELPYTKFFVEVTLFLGLLRTYAITISVLLWFLQTGISRRFPPCELIRN